MSEFELVLNSEGVKALLKSQEMKNICKEYADGIASRASSVSEGAEYSAASFVGQNRAGATVKPDNPHAYYSNLKHNTLLKAMK